MGTQDEAETWFQKGRAAIDRGDAVAAFDKATSLKPDYADAWFEKGMSLALLKRDEEALPALEKAISLKPDHAQARFWKGISLAALERYEEALAAYETALHLDPGDFSARNRKAQMLVKLGRHAEASFQEGMRWTILSTSADHLSDLREELENALAAFEEAIALKPDYAGAWFWKGENS